VRKLIWTELLTLPNEESKGAARAVGALPGYDLAPMRKPQPWRLVCGW